MVGIGMDFTGKNKNKYSIINILAITYIKLLKVRKFRQFQN